MPSLFLWEKVLGETATAATPFQKLRIDPLLILQLLAVLLLCLALARPFVWGGAVSGRTTVLVIDASASMNATDAPGTRLQAAVRDAEAFVRAKKETDIVAVVVAGAGANAATVLSPLSTNRTTLLAALRRVRATDAATSPRDAVLLAGSLAGSRPDARVLLFTDGVFPRQDEVSLGGAQLIISPVGRRGANAGITAFDVRETADGNAWEAFVTVRNAGDMTRKTTLTVRAGETLIEAREITVPSGETRSLVLPLAPDDVPQSAQLLSAAIEDGDDLSADNEAFAALPSRRAVRVLLVSTGDDPFLERALSLAPRATVRRVAPSAWTPKDTQNSDLTVWDSDTAPPARLPGGASYLFFGAVPAGANFPVSAGRGLIDAPPVLDWDRAAPLLRFANFAGVRVRTARRVTPAPWATVLIESRQAPLMVFGEKGDARTVYVAFRPTQSDLPLRVAFPVFVSNAVSTLATSNSGGEAARVVRPGDSGAADKTRVGLYSVKTKNGATVALGVSLLSDSETNTAPNPAPPLPVASAPGNTNAPSAAPHRAPQEWWQWLAAPLLLLLAVEWWTFFRRNGRR